MQETFDHFEFETVHPDAKRNSAGNDSFYTLEKGEEQMSSDDVSSTVGNGARRLSIAVARMSRQLFGDAMDSNKVESERKNVNPYLRARELDKRQSSGVVDIKKPPTSIAALTSPAAFKLSLKRTLSSTSASESVSRVWGVADTPVPPIPAHLSSSPGSTRSSSAGGSRNSSDARASSEEQHRSTTGSLSKLKTLQLPANRAAGLTISPDPFRKEGVKSGWY